MRIDKNDELPRPPQNVTIDFNNLIKALNTFANEYKAHEKYSEYTYSNLPIQSLKYYGDILMYPRYNRNKRKISWAFCEKNKRPRSAILIELIKTRGEYYFYILETERRKESQEAYSLLVYFREDFSAIDEYMHEEFMRNLAITRFIKYHETAERLDLIAQPLRHSSATAEAFGKRIKACVEKAITSTMIVNTN